MVFQSSAGGSQAGAAKNVHSAMDGSVARVSECYFRSIFSSAAIAVEKLVFLRVVNFMVETAMDKAFARQHLVEKTLF